MLPSSIVVGLAALLTNDGSGTNEILAVCGQQADAPALTPNNDSLPIPSTCGMTSKFPLQSADGWLFVKIAKNVTNPRHLALDSRGNLLVALAGKGIGIFTLGPDGCIASNKTLIDNPDLNHGITLSPDGSRLIVSSATAAFQYNYDAATQVASNGKTILTGMHRAGHSVRTVVIPPANPDLVIVSVGSLGNMDWPSIDKSVGRAVVKVFNLTEIPGGGSDYSSSGTFLGYGLRNTVSISIDNNNMQVVWGLDNGADNINRTIDGTETDIHIDEPAEELNYLGDPSRPNEQWYGYPLCHTVWSGQDFPDFNPITGSQFTPVLNNTWTDARCEKESLSARLSMQAHVAPLDGKFDKENNNLYVTLHGHYEPVAQPNSMAGYNDILWDPQDGCHNFKCFRPVGIQWDKDFTRMWDPDKAVMVLQSQPGKGLLAVQCPKKNPNLFMDKIGFTLEFFTKEGNQPLRDVFGHARTITSNLTSSSAAAQLRLWLDSNKVRLMEFSDEENGRCATMSHCWGSTETPKPTMTTKDNFEARKAEIGWNVLSPLFRDAIELCRKVECFYLWIDSLCIIQEDDEDWSSESRKMTQIYCNAYFNIAATAAPNSSGGLFLDRWSICLADPTDRRSIASNYLPTPLPRRPVHVRPSHYRDHNYVHCFPTFIWGRETQAPLMDRAWVMQELLLARRTIHICASELIWECKSQYD
ncbi:Cellobiose dehydrogenase-like protein [Paramyrothecium foliicola]|nr:Cellobiose dehydrogenase-like protein [Paramyrothecium foliicola]